MAESHYSDRLGQREYLERAYRLAGATSKMTTTRTIGDQGTKLPQSHRAIFNIPAMGVAVLRSRRSVAVVGREQSRAVHQQQREQG